jgi:hypothetical protein
MAHSDVLVTADCAESNLDAPNIVFVDEFLPPSDVSVRVALPMQVFHRRQMTEMPGRSSDG